MKRLNISFKDSELDLYNYLKTKRSASNFIKDLIEKEMNENRGNKNENR